jgi:hypothetical protein
MKSKFRWPSPTMAIAIAALFFALGGGAVAAVQRHYLITSTKQIKPSVLHKLKGAKGLRGAQGSQGLKSDPGATGAQGQQGPPGLSNLVTVDSTPIDLLGGYYTAPVAYCPTGTEVVGTGFYNSIADIGFVESYGSFVGGIYFNNTSTTATGVYVQAICATVATNAGPITNSTLTTQGDLQRFKADKARFMADRGGS